jgi:hypothetical protein
MSYAAAEDCWLDPLASAAFNTACSAVPLTLPRPVQAFHPATAG